MIATRCASLALCLALFPSAPSSPGAQDAPRVTRNDLQKAETERMEREIQGLWKVERVRLGHEEFKGSSLAGYLLAAPGYLSLELHLENFIGDSGFTAVEMMFQTGLHNYRFSQLGELEMFAMIGTNNIDNNGDGFLFEIPGERRKYQIELTPDHMTLERPQARMVLSRVSRPPHTSEEE